jgi:hypothetical protein
MSSKVSPENKATSKAEHTNTQALFGSDYFGFSKIEPSKSKIIGTKHDLSKAYPTSSIYLADS